MIQNIQLLSNNHVQIGYDFILDMVMIYKPNYNYPHRTYSGFDGLKEKYFDLVGSFTEDIDIQFSIEYFNPNFTQTIIQK